MPLPDGPVLLALMDLNWQEMCREIARATPGGWVEERDGFILCGNPRGGPFSNLMMLTAPVPPAQAREETERAFGRAGLPFSVWTRAHADGGLEMALPELGFRKLLEVPGMVFGGGPPEESATSPSVAVRPVADDAGREAYGRVMAEAYAVYGGGKAATLAHFETLASVVGPCTQAFLALEAGRPVAGATLYLSHGIGGIGWVGTLPEAFGRGYGTAVTWATVREGLRRGAHFLNLQASPMGAPLYRRMGFSTPTRYRVFVPSEW